MRRPAMRKTAIFPLVMIALVWVFIPFSAAIAVDMSGSADSSCFQYFVISKPVFDGGKALSPDLFEYNFSVPMTEGSGSSVCAESLRGTPYIAKVTGRWDEKGKIATETIVHQLPAKAKLHVITVSCSENPWTSKSRTACSTSSGIKCETITCGPRDYKCNSICSEYSFYNQPPVSTAFLTDTDRSGLGAAVVWGTGSFVLGPMRPPVIIVDDMEDSDSRSFSRGQDAKITLVPPMDGDAAEWYKRPWKYDVEVEVKTADSGKLAAPRWTKKPPVSVPGGVVRSNFILRYAMFFDDPASQWAIEKLRGDFRQARIRARVNGDAAVRPWSEWRLFYVEVPLTKVPATGSPVPSVKGLDSGATKVGGKTNTNVPVLVAPQQKKNVPAHQ
jgi:hypothetical protein